MSNRIAIVCLCLVTSMGVAPSLAQDPSPGAPVMCSAPQYKQFDFWLGEWDVHDMNGTLQGTNSISKIEGGCVLQELWTSASGGTGRSLNIYDFTRRTWHQTWVSGTTLLVLEGGLVDGKMVLEGTTVGQGGVTVNNRITWTPVSEAVVTQVWETSPDGETWTTIFNGRYTRSRR